MAFEMLKTEKGKNMLLFNCYIFVKEKESYVKSMRKCNQYFKNEYQGRVHLSDGKILKSTDHITIFRIQQTLMLKKF